MAPPARPPSGRRRRLADHRKPRNGGTICPVSSPPPLRPFSLFFALLKALSGDTGLGSPPTAATGHRRPPAAPTSLPFLPSLSLSHFPFFILRYRRCTDFTGRIVPVLRRSSTRWGVPASSVRYGKPWYGDSVCPM